MNDADYLYRVRMSKRQFADYLAENALNIRYDNFKNASCHRDRPRGLAYMRCWSTLLDWQEEIAQPTTIRI